MTNGIISLDLGKLHTSDSNRIDPMTTSYMKDLCVVGAKV